jgi:plastocyanin
VSISNFAFASASLTVNKGDKIVFTNRDSVGHTVTSDSGKFDGAVAAGQSFTLDTSNLTPGNYPYHCTPHPFMTGMIVVK